MKRYYFCLSIGAALLATVTTTFADLNNPRKSVQMVDVSKSERVYIHLGENMDSEPSCSGYNKIITCNLNDRFCEQAMKIALSAQLAGKDIEFDVSGCLGTLAEFTRLRIKP